MKHKIVKSPFQIPQGKKLYVFAAIAAGFVLLLAVTAVFLPRMIHTDDNPSQGVLRNPTTTQIPAGSTENRPTLPPEFTVPASDDFRLSVPDSANTAMFAVPTDAAVLLTTAGEYTEDTLSASLTVSPQIPLDITASGVGFLLMPTNGSWASDTLYRVSVDGEPDCLAVFQTVRTFAVDSVYPAHESTDVPTDTGIEITFTDTVRNTDLASYISVSPAIDGKFEIYPNGRTAVIIPDEPLEPETVYTVTVREGMPSDNGTTLNESRVFGFATMRMTLSQSESVLSFRVGTELLTSPGEEASLSYDANLSYFRDWVMSPVEVDAVIYQIPSAAVLCNMLKEGIESRGETVFADKVTLPTDGLTAVWEGNVEKYCENKWDTHERGWLYLPRLDEGIYLVSLHAVTDSITSAIEDTAQVLWQVTPLRAYTESVCTDTASDTLIWCHSTETGDAAAYTAVSAALYQNTLWHPEGDIPETISLDIRSDENGLANLRDNSGADLALLHLHNGGHDLVLCTSLASTPLNDTVRAHLYTDRSVYFANDTVYFHGVLGRTHPGQVLPDALSLNVAGNDTGIRIEVADDGSFLGSFAIEDWIGTRISMTLSDDDGTVSLYRSLSVTQQEKPLYTLDISYDRPYYTLENPTAVVTLQLSYFDGTPAPGMTLSVYTDHEGKYESVVTDEAGLATVTCRMPEENYTTTYPRQHYVSVRLSGYETVSLYKEEQTVYFHSSAVLSSRRVDRDHSILTLYALDTSRITAPEDYFAKDPYYPEILWGKPMNAAVSVTLEKHYYVKQKSGQTYYDPINKVTVDYYDYTAKTDIVKTYQAQVENGELRLDHIDARGEECSYYYVVSWVDPVCGRTYTERIRANRSANDYYPYDDNTPTFALTSNTDTALPGEEILLSLTYDEEPAVLTGTTVLYTRTTALDGRCDISAGNANEYRYAFDEACTLGAAVHVTVFDGTTYVTGLSHTAYYDEERGANAALSVTADRDTYKPGETAQITVRSPELAGGTVLVSIVDEACFALGEHGASYSDYFRFSGGNRYWGSSHVYMPQILRDSRHSLLSILQMIPVYRYSDDLKAEVEEAPAEDSAAPVTGGGSPEDPVYVREQFANTAAFVQITLDENGIGTTEITVPDNITSWRLTAIGFSGTGESGGDHFTSGVRCGTDASETVCTLPFFLNVTLPDLILSRDEAAFSARTAGTARTADPAASVDYTAVLYDETGTERGTVHTQAAADETAWFSFDPLPSGDYSVVVTGRFGDFSDAVRASFRVVDTAQIVRAQKTLSPTALSELNPAAYPLTLTFFDATDSLYYEVMSRLTSYNPRRTDAKAAAFAALMAEEALFGDARAWYSSASTAKEIRRELSEQYWGYLPLLRYAEGDPILTAEVLYCAPDVLTPDRKSSLIPLYESLLSEKGVSGEQTAAALLALACLDRPVLDLLYNAARYTDSMTDADILYLSAAFAAAGDLPAARALWEPLRDAWGQQEDGDAFSITGSDTEETIHLTALALLPASAVDTDTACRMVRYLQNHTSSVDLHVLELAAFLTHYTPTSAAETHLRYTTRTGEEIDVTLKRGQRHTVTLTKSDFAALTILEADEGIAAAASYGAAPADAMLSPDSTLKLHKTITPYDAETGIYRVTITYEGYSDADHLTYALTDTIPAGARFFVSEGSRSSGRNDNGYAYLSNNGGQQMKGTISVWNPTLNDKDMLSGTQPYSFTGTVSYLIRGAVKGEFVSEPALALNYETGTYACSEALSVTINDGVWTIK